jgi:hypothetical protein
MSMVMFATLMVIIFMFLFSELYQDNLKDKKRILFEDYGYSIQNEFIMASEARPGYMRSFFIPNNLEGFDFSINIIDTSLLINYTSNTFVLPIPKITGNIKKGSNMIINYNNTIMLN